MPRHTPLLALLLASALLGACATTSPQHTPDANTRAKADPNALPARFATADEGWRALRDAERARDLPRAEQIMARLRRDWRRGMTPAQQLHLINLDGDLARAAGDPDKALTHYRQVARATARLAANDDPATHAQGARAQVSQMILLNAQIGSASISSPEPAQIKADLQAVLDLARQVQQRGVEARAHRNAYWAQASVVEHARSMDLLADLIERAPVPPAIEAQPDAAQIYKDALFERAAMLRKQAIQLYTAALKITHDDPDSPWAALARTRASTTP